MYQVFRVLDDKSHKTYIVVDERGRVLEFRASRPELRKFLHALSADEHRRAS